MPFFAANLSFLWRNKPFLSRFEAAARMGFKRVEFMFPGDAGYEHSAQEVRKQLDTFNLWQVLLNAPAGNWAAGERGLAGLPKQREEEWRTSLLRGLDFAHELSCPNMHVMAGRLEDGATEDMMIERLSWACEKAHSAHVRLLVEPLNATDFPGYLVPDVATAQRIIERVGEPDHCMLQLDLYHLAMTAGIDALPGTVEKLAPTAGHIQIANVPGRHEPGHGDIDFDPLFKSMDYNGYLGTVGCEFKPSSESTEDALRWLQKHL
mmetsp:Transcript_70047/g.130941  ORF Transcript_70047/g.130941 Transcript_70047/m.130941 type:complete len:264 (-) Transcript_70047:15-806(-)